MKAKMYETLDVKDIPAKMKQLLAAIGEEIDTVKDKNLATYYLLSLSMEREVNVQCCIESIDSVRTLLAEIDAKLAGYSSVLNGFRSFIAEEEEKKQKQALLSEVIEQQSQAATPPATRPPVSVVPPKAAEQSQAASLPSEFVKKMMEYKDVNEG